MQGQLLRQQDEAAGFTLKLSMPREATDR